MGTIRIPIELIGTRSRKTVTALVDTGAYRNYLPEVFSDGQTVDSLGLREYRGKHTAILADQRETEGYRIVLDGIVISGLRVEEPLFVVLPRLVDEAILGALTMQEVRLKIDMGREKASLPESEQSHTEDNRQTG